MVEGSRPRKKPGKQAQDRHRSKARDRAREVRAHYRAHLDEHGHNPLLDDENAEGNIRHWTHGMREGNSQAGCRCGPCSTAAREYNEAAAEKRLDKRLATARVLAGEVIASRLADIRADKTIDLIVQAHRVARRDILTPSSVVFDRGAIELALRASKQRGLPAPDTADFDQLAGDLHRALNPGS